MFGCQTDSYSLKSSYSLHLILHLQLQLLLHFLIDLIINLLTNLLLQIHYDAAFVSSMDFLTSIISSCVVFSILGYLSHQV